VRVTLIHNPGAGDDDQPDGKALQKLVRDAGHEVVYHPAKDDAWIAELENGADVVAVAGGDGTVGRVAKKLIGRDIPVAPLPFGTANNISKTLGLTELTLKETIDAWDATRRIRFDVGIAKGPWGSRYFVEAFGIGLFARAIPAADENKTLARLKNADDKVAYAQEMLRERLKRASPHELTLELDGRDMSGRYVLFEAMNMEFVGPNLYLAPDIMSADGKLDVVLVTAAERDKLKESLKMWQDGDLVHPELPRHRVKRIDLVWDGFQVHFDDEAWPGEDEEPPPELTHIEVEVEHDAISFLAPSSG
jgi:diacylglycerol kinase family enzyme